MLLDGFKSGVLGPSLATELDTIRHKSSLFPVPGRAAESACPTEQHSRNQTCGARSLARHAGSPAGGTAGIAGLAARSTSDKSLREEKILRCCSTCLLYT